MNVQWPTDILPPRKVMVDPVYATVSAGRSITGVEQVVAGDAGYWAITLDEIPCVSRAQKQVARKLSVQLNGRLGLIDVPIWDPAIPTGNRLIDDVPWSGDVPFSDGSKFSTPLFLTAHVSGAVALGAAGMNIVIDPSTLKDSDGLEPGQHFSVQGATKERLYRIITSSLVTGSTYALTVWPPVREAISNGTWAEFNDPRCTCRAKTDAEFMTFVDDYAGRTLARVEFEEALP